MKTKKVVLDTLSSFCVNLSSGFAGAAVIVPIFSSQPIELNISALFLDLLIAILLLIVALKLKLWRI